MGLNCLAAEYKLEAVKLYNMGLEQNRVGAYTAAIDYFKEAIELQPDFYDAYYNAAAIYDYLGDYTNAIMYLDGILKNVPENSAANYKLAQIYYKKGDLEKAKEIIDNIAPTSQEYNKARQLADRIGYENKAKNQYAGKEIAIPAVPVDKKIKGINSPAGITADSNGQVYVASFSDNAIFKVMPNGIHQLYSKNPMISGPIGIAMDKNGNMYVANYNKNNILKITKYGEVSVFVKFCDKPYYVYVKNDILYVSEQGSNSVFSRKLN